MALDASADDRETRGFISMTTSSPVSRLSANWTFDPPVSTPTARITSADASRSVWYSRSVSVCAGATVAESPVCTPIGSTFSIEQTITTLSTRSRITSSSNSPQPATDSSSRICEIGLSRRPRSTAASNSSGVSANPPPCPPSVNAGRTTMGRCRAPVASAARASCIDVAMTLVGTRRPTEAMVAAKSSRSSARRIAS